MSKLQPIVTDIGKLLGHKKEDVVVNLTKWNKEKIYPVSLIDIKISADGVTDNSEKIGEIVGTIGDYVDDVVKNTLDAESVGDAKKTVAEIGKFLIETRKLQTQPLKDIAGHFTQHEAKFKEYSEALNKKIDAINEVEYQNRERAIREHFESRIKADELTEIVSMDAFVDFIANKRKTNIFTSKGALNKAIKDAISEALRVVVEPIKEANALKEKKALQSKQFHNYLDGIPSDGDTIVLEASIKSLERLKESIEELYPDIVEKCHRGINNKVSRCESNIRANKSEAEKDAVKNADGALMFEVDEIRVASQDMTLGVKDLDKLYTQLREIYDKLTFTENQNSVKALGTSIKSRSNEIKAHSMMPTGTPATTIEPSDKTTFLVSIQDIEVLAGMEIEAESQDEAKKELVRRFEAHLDMIELVKKEA